MQQQHGLNDWKIIFKGFSTANQEQRFCARLWLLQRARLLWTQTFYCCCSVVFFVQFGAVEYWWQGLNWQALACLLLWLCAQAMITWFGLQIESAKAGRFFLHAILTQHFVTVALLIVLLPQFYDVVMSSWFIYSLPVLLSVIYIPIWGVSLWLTITAVATNYLSYSSLDYQQFVAVLPTNLVYVALLLVAQSLLHLVWRQAYSQQLTGGLDTEVNQHAQVKTSPGEHILYVDSLTGFASFARFQQFSETEIERSSRYQNAYSIVLINVNHFSNYHDKLGGDDADKLLTSLANFLQSQIRKVDLLARAQADQFVIGLPESSLYQALDTAERIQDALDNEFWVTFPRDFDLGSRLGVACVDNTVTDIAQLLAKAESAMNNHRSAIALSYGR